MLGSSDTNGRGWGGWGCMGGVFFFGLKMLYVIYQTDLAVAYGDFSIIFTAVLPSSQ